MNKLPLEADSSLCFKAKSKNFADNWFRKRPISLYLPLIVATVLGAVLRFYHLGAEPLWVDEAATLGFAQLPLSELWGENALLETNPPLYYTLQKFWLIFGQSEAALRSLSAIIGTLTIPLLYALGRTLGGHWLGIIAATLLATSSIHIQYSQEARAYGLLTAAATLAIWGLTHLLTDPTGATEPVGRALICRRFRPFCDSLDANAQQAKPITNLAWLAYIIGVSVALYSHNTAVVLPILANCVAFLWWAKIGGFNKIFLWNWIFANTIPLLIWLWWLPIIIKQSLFSLKDFWIPYPTVEEIKNILINLYGYPLRFLVWRLANVLVMGLVLLGLWRWRHKQINVVLMATFAAGPPLLTILISLWRPIFILRTLIWTTVPFFVLVAAGISTFRTKKIAIILTAILLAIHLNSTAFYYQNFKKEPWDRVADYVKFRVKQSDAIFFFWGDIVGGDIAFNYYFHSPQSNIPQYVLTKEYPIQRKPLHQLVQQPIVNLSNLIQPFERIWLVTRNLERKDPKGLVLSELRRNMFELDYHNFGKLKVFLFDKVKQSD